MEKVEQRSLRYVKIHTKSDDNSTTVPTTERQFVLADMLEGVTRTIRLRELRGDVTLNAHTLQNS